MTTQQRSFASAAASSPVPIQTHPIPTGSWTLYFHEPEDKSWTPESYKRLQTVSSWEGLGTLLKELGSSKITNGMLFAMSGETSPLWENKGNIRGGSYCLKVPLRNAEEIFRIYLAAASLDEAATNPANKILGVTISRKKGFCIIKLWNASAKAFSNPAVDIPVLHPDVNLADVLYRPHTDQKM